MVLDSCQHAIYTHPGHCCNLLPPAEALGRRSRKPRRALEPLSLPVPAASRPPWPRACSKCSLAVGPSVLHCLVLSGKGANLGFDLGSMLDLHVFFTGVGRVVLDRATKSALLALVRRWMKRTHFLMLVAIS